MKQRMMTILGIFTAILCLMLTGCSKEQSSTQASAETAPATLKIEEAAGSEKKASVETAAAVTDEADEAEETKRQDGEALSSQPPFVYQEADPVMSGVCSWMTAELGRDYEIPENGVIIPEPVIYYTDDSNPEDVRVWGDFQIDIYTLEGETLMCQSGGVYPGLLHLKAVEGGNHAVTEFEACSDGAGFEEDARRLFGEAPEEAGDLVTAYFEDSASELRSDARRQFLKMYAAQVPETILYYQDFGWDPVSLKD